jgi:hypothetical protein
MDYLTVSRPVMPGVVAAIREAITDNALEPCRTTKRCHPELAFLTCDAQLCVLQQCKGRDAPLHSRYCATRNIVRGSLNNEDGIMRLNAFYFIAAAGLAISGCNKADSPADVQHDVATAQAEGQKDVADAKADASENIADANKDVAKAAADNDPKDVADQSKDVNDAAAKGDYKITVAQAEAAHKVATEKCEALSGAAQKDCKDRADNDLDHAKKQAETRRDGTG